ncbi:MAG: glycerol-3-phosphate 1-O-acyltransferase PlsY [Candidatus Omnitrophica bacterium]|nr:glycerol-3-phosphate 1-O-acyltransferase PlsY [Candidatus Omnitrophota bacterium]
MISAFMGLGLAYLLGSIPTGYITAKLVKKIDIRKYGSGNMGATNVFRVMGTRWGLFVLAFDIFKGFLAVVFLVPLFFDESQGTAALVFRMSLGFAAVAGHNWTLFLKFKGGKGVATTCGVFLAIATPAVLCAILVWILTVWRTKYISVASIVAAATCPAWIWLFYRYDVSFALLFAVSALIPLLIIYTHRPNISRLKAGTEPKITDRSKRI